MFQAVEAIIKEGRIQPVEPISMEETRAFCSCACNQSQQPPPHHPSAAVPVARKAA